MIIDRRIERNSGAVLEPCIYKGGSGVKEQGLKMLTYPAVFAPVILAQNDGYIMQVLKEPGEGDLGAALNRLTKLWTTARVFGGSLTDRSAHHQQQVKPYADAHPTLGVALEYWYNRTANTAGRPVTVVHGDPTLENYMAGGMWLDPSIRPMPLEAELDGGKLLQSYFCYSGSVRASDRGTIKRFLYEEGLNIDLCLYYMVTHVVRLYRVQKQARPWALDLLYYLTDEAKLVKELRCK